MIACDHPGWEIRDRESPLTCVDCGVPWPGYDLPLPFLRYEGYGELGELPSWSSRVAAMVEAL